MNVLVIDDETSLRRTLRTALEVMGHTVAEAGNAHEALDHVSRRSFDLAFLDLRLGQSGGLDLLPDLLRQAHGMQVIVITAYATVGTAVEAMRRGAFDYLPKPFTPDDLRLTLERVKRARQLELRVADLEAAVRSAAPEAELETNDPSMQQALDLALRAAPSDATVLLRGESGTGKGIMARAIHARSRRGSGPFVTVHCPSLSAELLESELFGHARGAFTGAVRETTGKVAAAEGGTLFLDEVGELPLPLQPKLLRLLQERRYERVGETQTRVSDVRIVAATNRDLAADAAASRFREDLYYRLNVMEIVLPPLRQRRADILPLAQHLLLFFARQAGKHVTGFTPQAEESLLRHAWPGNVRELRNAVERGVILAMGDHVGLADLPAQVGSPGPREGIALGGRVTLEHLEEEHIRRVLLASPTMEDAAATLGIDPSTLYRKRKRYGL